MKCVLKSVDAKFSQNKGYRNKVLSECYILDTTQRRFYTVDKLLII